MLVSKTVQRFVILLCKFLLAICVFVKSGSNRISMSKSQLISQDAMTVMPTTCLAKFLKRGNLTNSEKR